MEWWDITPALTLPFGGIKEDKMSYDKYCHWVEGLDEKRVRELLQEADDKWFRQHSGKYEYEGHLDFVADYIAKNYYGESKKSKAVPTTQE